MNENKFLTLLMGECWHDYIEIFNHKDNELYRCRYCNIGFSYRKENNDHLSNPLPVIKWMDDDSTPCAKCERLKNGEVLHPDGYGCYIKHPALIYLEQEVKDER